MARILGMFPAALIAARGGMSANAFYRQLRELDIAPRRSEVLSLYKVALRITATSGDEIFRDQETVPAGHELEDWPTKKATGVRQNVTISYRDRATGVNKTVFWSTTSPEGITREQAKAMAINAYASHAEAYDQELIDAVHTGAYRYMPFPEE